MKRMTIERTLEVTPIVMAEQVRLQCQVMYQTEEDGIRAIGNIYVRGIYSDGMKKKPLKEVIALDVFAPNDKLNREEVFSIQIYDSHFDIQNECLVLTVDLDIQGVDIEDEVIEIVPTEMEFVNEEEQLIYKNEEVYPIIEESSNGMEELDIVEKEESEEVSEEVDIFYQQEGKIGCRMILLKESMSYEMLASKYQVDLQQLQILNHHKKLNRDTLVLLPEK